jgi:predicted ATPase
VTHLPLGPLSARETARIAQARIGVEQSSEPLLETIAARAEGNALFAEEIASFLIERGIVHRSAFGLDYDAGAVGAVLPESVQSLLASRVDNLVPADRKLLQAAAVIGRRFDPDPVSAVCGASGSLEASFAATETLDLIQRAEGADDYVFKHALVRDAVYNGLLSAPRSALHLKVAEQLERRNANRLGEIAETLAHHYAATTRADKAFAYLLMAGDKSLDVYSISAAEHYYREALGLFEAKSTCADRPAAVRVVIRLLETLHQKCDYREIRQVAGKFMPFVQDAGETPELVFALYYQGLALYANLEFRTAHRLFEEALAIAERLGNAPRAYARCALLQARTVLALDSLETAEEIKAELLRDSLSLRDNQYP